MSRKSNSVTGCLESNLVLSVAYKTKSCTCNLERISAVIYRENIFVWICRESVSFVGSGQIMPDYLPSKSNTVCHCGVDVVHDFSVCAICKMHCIVSKSWMHSLQISDWTLDRCHTCNFVTRVFSCNKIASVTWRVAWVFNSCATLFPNRALLYSVQLCWRNAERWLVSCHCFCFASVRCTYSFFANLF